MRAGTHREDGRTIGGIAGVGGGEQCGVLVEPRLGNVYSYHDECDRPLSALGSNSPFGTSCCCVSLFLFDQESIAHITETNSFTLVCPSSNASKFIIIDAFTWKVLMVMPSYAATSIKVKLYVSYRYRTGIY